MSCRRSCMLATAVVLVTAVVVGVVTLIRGGFGGDAGEANEGQAKVLEVAPDEQAVPSSGRTSAMHSGEKDVPEHSFDVETLMRLRDSLELASPQLVAAKDFEERRQRRQAWHDLEASDSTDNDDVSVTSGHMESEDASLGKGGSSSSSGSSSAIAKSSSSLLAGEVSGDDDSYASLTALARAFEARSFPVGMSSLAVASALMLAASGLAILATRARDAARGSLEVQLYGLELPSTIPA